MAAPTSSSRAVRAWGEPPTTQSRRHPRARQASSIRATARSLLDPPQKAQWRGSDAGTTVRPSPAAAPSARHSGREHTRRNISSTSRATASVRETGMMASHGLESPAASSAASRSCGYPP